MQKTLQEQITSFQKKNNIKTIRIHDQLWHYYDIGYGNKTIVIFPDIMGTYESWLAYTPILEKNYRILIPFYPPIHNLEEMITSLHAFLKTCKVSRYSLIGSSLGGLFAQLYVRKYSQEVERLLLIGTGTADKVFGTIAAGLFLPGILLPQICMQYFIFLAANLSLSVKKENRSFWLRYVKKQIWKVDTKQSLLAWGRCVLELCWKYKFHTSDLKKWDKPIYLIEANNDFVFNPLTRHHLRSLYPQATCYTLKGGNHLLWINRVNQVSKILQKFIP